MLFYFVFSQAPKFHLEINTHTSILFEISFIFLYKLPRGSSTINSGTTGGKGAEQSTFENEKPKSMFYESATSDN